MIYGNRLSSLLITNSYEDDIINFIKENENMEFSLNEDSIKEKIKAGFRTIKENIIRFFKKIWGFVKEKVKILKRKIIDLKNKILAPKGDIDYPGLIQDIEKGIEKIESKEFVKNIEKISSDKENFSGQLKEIMNTMYPDVVFSVPNNFTGFTKNTDYDTFEKELNEFLKEENLNKSRYKTSSDKIVKGYSKAQQSVDHINKITDMMEDSVKDPLVKLLSKDIIEDPTCVAALNTYIFSILKSCMLFSKTVSSLYTKYFSYCTPIAGTKFSGNTITQTFIDCVNKGEVQKLRIMMTNSLLLDYSFSEFNEMEKLARNVPGLYDKQNDSVFIEDKTKWNDDYMHHVDAELEFNFSHERIKHLKEVIRYLHPVGNNKESDSSNDKAISPEFKDAVKRKKTLRVKIMLKDSMILDRSFKSFDTMSSYAIKNGIDLYDEDNDEIDMVNDKSKWTEDYMNSLFVALVNNFSKKKINHLKQVIPYVYSKKKPINKKHVGFTSFDEDEFWKHIETKDYPALKINTCSTILNDPTFERDELSKVLKILEKEVPEIFEEYHVNDWEERLEPKDWTKRYFSKLVYYLQENFCKDRLDYIKKVGRAVHQDTAEKYRKSEELGKKLRKKK